MAREALVGVLPAAVEKIPVACIENMRAGRQVVFRVAADFLRLRVPRVAHRVVTGAARVAHVHVKIIGGPVADGPEPVHHRRAGDAIYAATRREGGRVSAVGLQEHVLPRQQRPCRYHLYGLRVVNQPVGPATGVRIRRRIEGVGSGAVNVVERHRKIRKGRRAQFFAAHHVDWLRVGADMMQPDGLHHGRKAMRCPGDVVVAGLVGAVDIVGNNSQRLAPGAACGHRDSPRCRHHDTTSMQLHFVFLPCLGRLFWWALSARPLREPVRIVRGQFDAGVTLAGRAPACQSSLWRN